MFLPKAATGECFLGRPFFYAHAVTPSDVPMAVKMVISVWMMIFQMSFLLLMMIKEL